MDKLDTLKPDVILLDVLMPVMNGIEFLRTAQPKTKHPAVKILVLSNLSDPKTLQEITELGGDKYLLKASVSPAELVDAVKALLKH
jgi:DNA-binding NarL/FixJ family response regulator